MHTLTLAEIGQPIQYKQVADPVALQGSNLVSLSASALNHRDLWISKGMYPGIKTPVILGSDGVGEIDSRSVIINPGLNWGDDERVQSDAFQVLGMPKHGTFAEYISIPDKYIYDTPDHLSDIEAAALPLAGVTAYRVLMTRCQLRSTDRVLVTGTGGGVALFAVQFALALGCEVHVTSGSADKIRRATAMGVARGFNYKQDDWHKQIEGGYDVIIDSAGGDGFQHLIKLCNPGARIGFYGATLGKYQNLNPQLLFWRQISIIGSTMGSDRDFADMLAFVSKHKIVPVIDRVYPLSEGAQAFDRMAAGDQFGKIVLNHQA